MSAPAIDLTAAAERLAQSNDYRVLRRFVPREIYREESWNLGEPHPVRLGLFVDLETTGLDRERDEIIEFAAVPFMYDALEGEVLHVLPSISGFEQPTIAISDEIQALTGITPDMVRGQRLDDERVNLFAQEAQVVIAHNAKFDRQIAERRFPIFASKHWACSQIEVPWKQFGVAGAKLQHVLADACGEFYDAHRALDDCLVGVHCLAVPRTDGHSALWHLLESAREPTIRITAIDSPFSAKSALKARRLSSGARYRWSDGSTQRKGWSVDVKPAAVEAEIEWLLVEIYRGRVERRHAIATRKLSSRDRYSIRAD